MPKGLYFTVVGFLSFFFFISSFPMINLWSHWTDLNQPSTHIHLWLLFEKFGPNSPGHLPPTGWGQKPAFGDRIWTLTEHISATEHDINNQKETTGTPLHAPTFGEFWSRNGWERLASFCPPPNFSHWETLPSPHGRYSRHQANVGTCYVKGKERKGRVFI